MPFLKQGCILDQTLLCLQTTGIAQNNTMFILMLVIAQNNTMLILMLILKQKMNVVASNVTVSTVIAQNNTMLILMLFLKQKII